MLTATIACDAFVWFLGSVQLQLLNVMAIQELGYSKSMASTLKAGELRGIAGGGLAAGKLIAGRRWFGVLAPSAAAMGVVMCLVPAAACLPARAAFWCLLGLFAAAGLTGGLFMIPCESFIQVRPPAERRGAIIAASNFVIFIGIVLSAPAAWAMQRMPRPSVSFVLLGAMSLAVAAALRKRMPREDAA